jgi:hypothetical protein
MLLTVNNRKAPLEEERANGRYDPLSVGAAN